MTRCYLVGFVCIVDRRIVVALRQRMQIFMYRCVRIIAYITMRLQCTFHSQTHPSHVIAIHTTNLKVWCHECNQEVFPRANIPGWQWAERFLSDNNVERIASMGANGSRVLLQ